MPDVPGCAGQGLDPVPAGARSAAGRVRGDWPVCSRSVQKRRFCLHGAHSVARLAGKKSEDNLFDLIDPTKVNKHLQELMPGLTIKVFRTYNASITLSRLLKDTEEDLDVPGKKAQVRQLQRFDNGGG